MAEPKDHTLRLLQDIRGAVQAVDSKVDRLGQKVDGNHEDLTKRISSLQQAMIGESVLGRYTVAEVEERLDAIEQRLSVLEKR